MQSKASSVMDFLEKPEKLSDTDKAEKVKRWHCKVFMAYSSSSHSTAVLAGCKPGGSVQLRAYAFAPA